MGQLIIHVSKWMRNLLTTFVAIYLLMCIPLLIIFIVEHIVYGAVFSLILTIFPILIMYSLSMTRLLHVCISSSHIISKLYFLKKNCLSWENVRYVAVFIGISGKKTFGTRYVWSPYILFSDYTIDKKHCYLTSYKPRTQIAIRIGEDNADTILPIINEKLGLSLSYEQLLEIKFKEPVILDLTNR